MSNPNREIQAQLEAANRRLIAKRLEVAQAEVELAAQLKVIEVVDKVRLIRERRELGIQYIRKCEKEISNWESLGEDGIDEILYQGHRTEEQGVTVEQGADIGFYIEKYGLLNVAKAAAIARKKYAREDNRGVFTDESIAVCVFAMSHILENNETVE